MELIGWAGQECVISWDKDLSRYPEKIEAQQILGDAKDIADFTFLEEKFPGSLQQV